MTATLAEQRRGLPDQPGVYLFRDGKGRVIYVGKAKSIRKRVASHFAKAQVPSSPGHAEMVAAVEQIEFVVVGSEAEALLAEQSFIKQYRPRFNIRLRDDKSYPFIAISLDEDFPRVYFTRERHRPGRAYFGPYSNAKRVRGTLDLLTKIFMFRSCTGTEPGRRSAPVWTITSSAARPPASGMSPGRSTGGASTAWWTSSPGATARSSATCGRE
jgi:excinuclease ABC subunit C